MKAYSLQDSRIKVVCQKNQYAGMARNKGMEYASGKYYAFLDADDFLKKLSWNKCMRQRNKMHLIS